MLELILKTKENHSIEQEGKPDFRDGITEMGFNVTVLYKVLCILTGIII